MADSVNRDAFTLKRWSQRKLAAARADETPVERTPATPAAQPGAVAPASGAAADGAPAVELPAIDSLTIDSDFTAFLRPGVDQTLRRSALRKLFSDPRFNVMDGLDVYIDDYSKPELLDAAVARTLAQARYIFDPPKTRVNAQGFVEDAPPEEASEEPAQAQPSSQAPQSADATKCPDRDAGTESGS
jgi:hypothetical protein